MSSLTLSRVTPEAEQVVVGALRGIGVRRADYRAIPAGLARIGTPDLLQSVLETGDRLSSATQQDRVAAGLLFWELRSRLADGEYGQLVGEFCDLVDIAPDTLYRWRKQAEEMFQLPPPPAANQRDMGRGGRKRAAAGEVGRDPASSTAGGGAATASGPQEGDLIAPSGRAPVVRGSLVTMPPEIENLLRIDPDEWASQMPRVLRRKAENWLGELEAWVVTARGALQARRR